MFYNYSYDRYIMFKNFNYDRYYNMFYNYNNDPYNMFYNYNNDPYNIMFNIYNVDGYNLFQNYNCDRSIVLQLFCRCKIPGYDNDTFLEQSDYHRQLINMSIPDPDDPDSIYKYDRCHIIQYKSNVSSQVKCTEWVYDKSVFQETFASKVGIGLIVI